MLAGDICKEALALQGLPVPVAIAANNNDATARQVWAQLRNQGRRFCKPTATHRWQVLKREWVLDTVPGTTRYAFPLDFDSFNDLTAWNKSSRLPMLGPATDAQWQTLKVRSLGSSTISMVYRVAGDKLELYNSPSDAQQLTIIYNSRAWVQLESSPDPANPVYADAPVADGDLVLFDPEMMVAAVQYGFMTAKGFDTSEIGALVDRLLEAAIDSDSDAPVLGVAGSEGYPLLSTHFNVPDTGYGA
jgi:hypothetical protein